MATPVITLAAGLGVAVLAIGLAVIFIGGLIFSAISCGRNQAIRSQ